MWRPPDKNSNFSGGCKNIDRIKRPKRSHSQTSDKCVDAPPSKKKCARTPILVGKNIEMEFANEDGSTTWWLGRVTKYNSTNDTYEAFFADDDTTVEFNAIDEDYRIVSK